MTPGPDSKFQQWEKHWYDVTKRGDAQAFAELIQQPQYYLGIYDDWLADIIPRKNHYEMFQCWIKNPYFLHDELKVGNKMLVSAARHGRLHMVKDLLNQGFIKVNGNWMGPNEALKRACDNEHYDIACLLVEHGAELFSRGCVFPNVSHEHIAKIDEHYKQKYKGLDYCPPLDKVSQDMRDSMPQQANLFFEWYNIQHQTLQQKLHQSNPSHEAEVKPMGLFQK